MQVSIRIQTGIQTQAHIHAPTCIDAAVHIDVRMHIAARIGTNAPCAQFVFDPRETVRECWILSRHTGRVSSIDIASNASAAECIGLKRPFSSCVATVESCWRTQYRRDGPVKHIMIGAKIQGTNKIFIN